MVGALDSFESASVRLSFHVAVLRIQAFDSAPTTSSPTLSRSSHPSDLQLKTHPVNCRCALLHHRAWCSKKILCHCFRPPLPRPKRDIHIIRSRRSQQMLTLPSLLPQSFDDVTYGWHEKVPMTTGEFVPRMRQFRAKAKQERQNGYWTKKERKKASVFTWIASA